MHISRIKPATVALVDFDAFTHAVAGFTVSKLGEILGTSAKAQPLAFPVRINGDVARAYIARAHLDDEDNKDMFEATAVIDPSSGTVHHLEIRVTGAGIQTRVVREEALA